MALLHSSRTFRDSLCSLRVINICIPLSHASLSSIQSCAIEMTLIRFKRKSRALTPSPRNDELPISVVVHTSILWDVEQYFLSEPLMMLEFGITTIMIGIIIIIIIMYARYFSCWFDPSNKIPLLLLLFQVGRSTGTCSSPSRSLATRPLLIGQIFTLPVYICKHFSCSD